MFEFVIKLRDEMTSSAEKATKAVRNLSAAQKALEVTQRSGVASALELAAAQDAVTAASAEAAAATGAEGLMGAVASLVDPLQLAAAAAAAAVGAFVALGVAMVAGAKTALDATAAHNKLVNVLGSGTLNMIRQLEREVPESEQELAAWAQTLKGAGVTDLSKVRDQIKAIASAQELVNGGGEKVKSLLAKMAETGAGKAKFNIRQLAGTGVTAQEFANALGMKPENIAAAVKSGQLTGTKIADAVTTALIKKGQGPLAAATEGMGAQWTKLKDNVTKLFESVNVKPFLDGMKSLLGIFDQSTASGKTFKLLVTSAFDAIFKIAGKVLPYVKHFLLDIAIAGLKFHIAIKPIVAQLGDLFSSSTQAGSSFGWVDAVADAVTAMGHVFILAARGVLSIVNAFRAVSAMADEAIAAGENFVNGLIAGIQSGASAVAGAVRNIASSALDAFKNTLGIHSPSAVMMQMGAHVGTGLEQGISGKGGDVQNAMNDLARPPQVTSNRSSSSAQYNIIVQVGAGQDAQATAKAVRLELADLFDSIAQTQGA